MTQHVTIFTDGASRGNPGPGGWGAIIALRESDERSGEVLELGGRDPHTTNNRMELQAAISALGQLGTLGASRDASIEVFTDSRYLINGITKWVAGWQKKNWMTAGKTEVLNKDLWEQLADLSDGREIEWKYVGGHAGIAGNERVDVIATECADGKKASFYSGPLAGYGINMFDISVNAVKSEAKQKDRSRQGKKAYSYLSLLDGKIGRHSTWPECERRVKGKNAKFKKSLDAADERNILREWGFPDGLDQR